MTKKNTGVQHESPPFRLFVYGTLKRGYWNFERYCRNAIDIQPATVWGRLYQLPAGYPAIEVPETSILAHGTDDPAADALTQFRQVTRHTSLNKPAGDWGMVHGEIMMFPDPARDLPPIDRLEGFSPMAENYYKRVLVLAMLEMIPTAVWLYAMGLCPNAKQIASGIWERWN